MSSPVPISNLILLPLILKIKTKNKNRPIKNKIKKLAQKQIIKKGINLISVCPRSSSTIQMSSNYKLNLPLHNYPL
jgi:hypothetical protein